jgi:hypothetical protein
MRARLVVASISFVVAIMATCVGCSRYLDKDLVNAAYVGDVGEIKTLIQRGASPDALAVDGWTPLTMAAREGRLEAVDVPLRSGAEIDKPEGGGNTALFWAVFDGHRDVVELLLPKGANPNKKASGGETPLHLAVRLNHGNVLGSLRQAGKNSLLWSHSVQSCVQIRRPWPPNSKSVYAEFDNHDHWTRDLCGRGLLCAK